MLQSGPIPFSPLLPFKILDESDDNDRKRMKEAVEAISIQALAPGSPISTSYVSEQEAAFLSLLGHPTISNLQARHCSLDPRNESELTPNGSVLPHTNSWML